MKCDISRKSGVSMRNGPQVKGLWYLAAFKICKMGQHSIIQMIMHAHWGKVKKCNNACKMGQDSDPNDGNKASSRWPDTYFSLSTNILLAMRLFWKVHIVSSLQSGKDVIQQIASHHNKCWKMRWGIFLLMWCKKCIWHLARGWGG